jgi:glycosyltransferase involved in cell wall biosynthesis
MTNAQMLIAGDGECKEALQNQAKNLGIWEDCHFPGFISAKGDLPGVYRMADVFATASEIETQGLVLLEALASGLPVVAVEATCIPELVHNTINGFLHQPNDVDAFADSLTHLIHNPVQARQMGQVGRRLAEKHSIQYALNQHENLYQKTIVQHRKTIHTSWRGAWMSHLRFF